MINDVALILFMEKNKKINNNIYYYEYEILRLISSFRKNAGIYKNIPIHILHDNEYHISNIQKSFLNLYDNIYFHIYEIPKINYSPYAFINIPFTGYYFTNIAPLDEIILIQFDVDVEITSQIPYDIIDDVKIKKNTHISSGGKHHIDDDVYIKSINLTQWPSTHMIFSHKESHFYQKYYQLLTNTQFYEKYSNVNAQAFNYYYDEFAVKHLIDTKCSNILLNTNMPQFYNHHHMSYNDVFIFMNNK